MVYRQNARTDANPPAFLDGINLFLVNPPYTIELWDDDMPITTFNAPSTSDDFGGSFTISTTSGTNSWSVNGNTGSYVVSTTGNPAVDVHWGMEKTYDYYLNTFNRKSFDGNGAAINQYINPPDLQSRYGEKPNNAYAKNRSINSYMAYGMGDGITMKPVVGLDVEGHEFTHLVTDNNGHDGLEYSGESGALNESFSDIFGTAIEFYVRGNDANWLIGEDITINTPYCLRSMENPKIAEQPNTYKGEKWIPTSYINNDYGGVHTNSGVQNYWFYLLCQGGSGTNDLGNSYSVTGIGIADAQQIAYRNLINYLTPTATYMDAYIGSLQAAEDLFGNPSQQYSSVRQAWYAVGSGSNPDTYCSGTTTLTASSGVITDGSGSANYNDNADCVWTIAPEGATQITLNFTAFDTEANFDKVFVYEGPDTLGHLLATWWGSTLPPTIKTSAGIGAMCINFKSDNNTTKTGWSATYSATCVPPTCGGDVILSNPSGTFSDGSGSGFYGNNQMCYWMIAPPCATSVTLSFSQFSTEENSDGVVVYDGWENPTVLAVLTGTTLPQPITSNTGKMVVVFSSDYSTTMQGFTANYTSTGAKDCSVVTQLNTSDHGTFTDGSGTSNYCDNLDSRWLIQPPQAISITLDFTEFDVEAPGMEGAYFDFVEIYDGTSSSDSLLGRFAGNTLPPTVRSTGGSMLVRFVSDIADNAQGVSAKYTSIQAPYCSDTVKMTTATGSFNDGSGTNQYTNSCNCTWLINPVDVSSITLNFSSFDTETDHDGIIVYDGENSSSPIIGQFSGNSIPQSITSSAGSMFVEFLSDNAVRGNGWSASYTSTPKVISVTGISLNETTLSLEIGATATLAATITPSDATNKTVAWSSSNIAIATINDAGLVTAIAAGTATITATTENGGYTAECILTVTEEPQPPTGVADVEKHSRASLHASPNPTNSWVTVEHAELQAGDAIEVFSTDGKPVASFTASGQTSRINLDWLAAGTYILRVARIGATVKVVKQ